MCYGVDTVAYGHGYATGGDSLVPYVEKIAADTRRALPPGTRYEVRAAYEVHGGYYVEEDDHALLSQWKQLLAVVLPLRVRQRYLYTYVPGWCGWAVVWYSLPMAFARDPGWQDFLHTELPPAKSDFVPMDGVYCIGRGSV